MKKIGIIGGMSWESTALYYRLMNQQVAARLGKHRSAKLVIESVDFEEIKALQFSGQWQEAANKLIICAQNLERSGARYIVIATNTMHKVAPEVQASISIPLLHIADATGAEIKKAGFRSVGFLGTQFSMEETFYTQRLKQAFSLDVLIPSAEGRKVVHDVIYNELCLGVVKASSRTALLNIMASLINDGAQCIIEGCTEITMLVDENLTDIPLFDTTRIHASYAVDIALGHSEFH